jgi:predicted TIM-barrel fold metal-dependent hydrolase
MQFHHGLNVRHLGRADNLLIPPFPFIDAHVHLWDLGGCIGYPWLTGFFDESGPNGSVEAIAHDYGLDDYLLDAGEWSPVAMVHVDAGAEAADALAETEWLSEIAATRGLPNAVVAFAALDDPEVNQLLAAHAVYPNVRGIRHIVNWHPDPQRTYSARDVTLDPAWEAGFSALARHGLSFDLQCYPGQMPRVATIAARHPDVPVIINHMGMPVCTDADGLEDWRRGMKALAALPQVAVKLSGLGFIQRDWTLDTMRPLLLETTEMFSPDRILFASDFPTDRLFASFDACLSALDAATRDFSDDERRAMWGGNAQRIYRIALP